MAKKLIVVIALAGLLLVLVTGLALGNDPTGATTGTATDVAAATSGTPTTAELAADLGQGTGWNGVEGSVRGLFDGGEGGQLAAQAIAAVVVVVWSFGLMYVFLSVQKRVQGIRVTRDEEMIGLDIPEMGVPAYPASPHL